MNDMNKQTEDLAKLADAFFANLIYDASCEYGSIGVDCKRPFGNSDVNGDILEIIGAQMQGDDGEGPCWASHQLEYAASLYQDRLIPYLRAQWSALRRSTDVGKS